VFALFGTQASGIDHSVRTSERGTHECAMSLSF
jgi:hypothetical protein